MIVSIGILPLMAKRFTIPGTYWRMLAFSAGCYLVPPALAAWARGNTPWLGLGLAIGGRAPLAAFRGRMLADRDGRVT